MNNNEIKKERFVRIAEKRTNTILATLKLLGNCSNKHNYEYTNEQVRQIFSAIENELRITKTKFNNDDKKFSLRG